MQVPGRIFGTSMEVPLFGRKPLSLQLTLMVGRLWGNSGRLVLVVELDIECSLGNWGMPLGMWARGTLISVLICRIFF